MLFHRKRWLYAGLITIIIATLILPWQPLFLFIVYSTPEAISLSGEVSFGAYTGQNSHFISCFVLLTAKGPIGAFNPVNAKVDVIMDNAVSVLENELNFSVIRVILWGSLAFPYNSTNYPYSAGIIDLSSTTSQNEWSNSKLVVYLTSGQFDVSVEFENASYVVGSINFSKAVTIESSETTFSYVTSLVFVSLELILVGMMLLDFSTHARSDADQKHSRDDQWIVPY